MSSQRGPLGFMTTLADGAKTVLRDVTESATRARTTSRVPVPEVTASVAEKIAYVDEAQLSVGRLEAPAGAAIGDERSGLTRGIALPLLVLLRANADTNPDLVDAVLEPLLAHRRKLS